MTREAPLKIQIIRRLRTTGAANSETLAFELNVPSAKVRQALEQLRDTSQNIIQQLPFGLWDVFAKKAA